MRPVSKGARHVLVVAQRPSDYVEMRRCIVALRQRGYRISIQYHCIHSEIEREIEVIKDIGALQEEGAIDLANIISSSRPAIAIKAPPLRVRRERKIFGLGLINHPFVQSVRTFLRRTTIDLIRLIKRHVGTALLVPLVYLKRYRDYKRFICSAGVSLIILPEDVVGSVTPLLIRAGHVNGVPSLILPYTIANQQEAFQSLSGQPNYQHAFLPNKIVSWFFPRWIMKQNGLALVRLPAWHILGQQLTRTTPPDPWMMNSGYANAVAVENDAMRDYYTTAGIPASKMRVVGAIYDDVLAAVLKDREAQLVQLRRQLALADKPLLLIGGCPDQSAVCPGFEFRDMADLSAKLAEAVAPLRKSHEILVRPHPNCRDFGDMLAMHGIRSTMIDTAHLVALSSLYIAFASATIRWAIACGVPTINYDVFHYDYTDFKSVPGVLNVARYEDFVRAMHRMQFDDTEHAQLAEQARRSAPHWGRLDGKSVDRIVELIEELCALKRVRRTAA